MLRKKDILAEAGQGFGKGDGEPRVEALDQDFHRPRLQDPECAHSEQRAEHRGH